MCKICYYYYYRKKIKKMCKYLLKIRVKKFIHDYNRKKIVKMYNKFIL